MLVTLAEAKTYLGISATTHDTWMTDQLQMLSDTVEAYCGRKFESASYAQTYYQDMHNPTSKEICTYHYPIVTLTSIAEITDVPDPLSTTLTVDVDYRYQKPLGKITNVMCWFRYGRRVLVTYTAGYATIPSPIKHVIYCLIEERYNKKLNNIGLNFGSDVQSISIPGTISIAFDYSLQSNERKYAYGMTLGNYVNILDTWRSERKVIGDIKEVYLA